MRFYKLCKIFFLWLSLWSSALPQILQVSVELEKKEYLFSEPVIVLLHIKNISGQRIEKLPDLYEAQDQRPPTYQLIIHDSVGNLLKTVQNEYFMAHYDNHILEAGDSTVVGFCLPAHTNNVSMDERAVLNEMRNMYRGKLMPGSYSLSIIYTFATKSNATGTTSERQFLSNEVKFSIVDPESTDEKYSYKIYKEFVENDLKSTEEKRSDPNYDYEYFNSLITLKEKITSPTCRVSLLIEILGFNYLRNSKYGQYIYDEEEKCLIELLTEYPGCFRLIFINVHDIMLGAKGKLAIEYKDKIKKSAYYRNIKQMRIPGVKELIELF